VQHGGELISECSNVEVLVPAMGRMGIADGSIVVPTKGRGFLDFSPYFNYDIHSTLRNIQQERNNPILCNRIEEKGAIYAAAL